jgi:hypothetical protein
VANVRFPNAYIEANLWWHLFPARGFGELHIVNGWVRERIIIGPQKFAVIYTSFAVMTYKALHGVTWSWRYMANKRSANDKQTARKWQANGQQMASKWQANGQQTASKRPENGQNCRMNST